MTVTVTISHNTPGKVVHVDRAGREGGLLSRIATVQAGDDHRQVVTLWKEVELVLTEEDIVE